MGTGEACGRNKDDCARGERTRTTSRGCVRAEHVGGREGVMIGLGCEEFGLSGPTVEICTPGYTSKSLSIVRR